jgi:hypothetical protein
MMRPVDAVVFILLAAFISLLLFFSIDRCEKQQPVPKPDSPPPATPTVPAVPDEPPFTVVDFEDMAGLDAATQELLNQRYDQQGPGDFEKRLRRLEREMAAVLDRVFGRSVLPGEKGE